MTAQEHCLTLHEMKGGLIPGLFTSGLQRKSRFPEFAGGNVLEKETGGAILARALNTLDEAGALMPEREATTMRGCKYYPFPVGDVLSRF